MSTERMNDNQGTAGKDSGTDRMDAGTARMDGNKDGAVTATGVVFASGQTVVLNGRNCVIESTISGSSGEAVVYKVIIDSKPYALKHYKPNMPLSDTAKKVIAKIKDNPGDRIIKIYDFGSYNGQDFEIMEYAEGGSLDRYIKSNGALHDTTKIKNIVKMIVEGLEQLHGGYRVIYQDLKPENIYFKDANKTSIVLADFGISSIMEGYDEEVEVTASVTDLYAAPELRHKANRKEVMATPSVDYFALGITMFELWLGEKPFKGIRDAKRDSLIDDEEVDLPIDMPNDYAMIIQGLIKPKRKDRWGNEQVKKWLKGETLSININVSKKASTAYDPLKFSDSEYASNPKELAALMEKYPDMGKSFLYDDFITGWLKKAGDVMLFNKIQNITSQYAKDKETGLYAAILALDPERPFKSRSGKICKTTEDIADAIMAESAYYMEELKKPSANLYLYLEAAEGSRGKEAADIFCKNFKEFTPKRALALVYLKLQTNEGITIGSKHYQSPDELKHEKDAAQIDLIKKAVTEKDSMLLVWLADTYGGNLKSTDTFSNLSALEQFFLLGLMPYLSFKELNGNSRVLQDLIVSYPGRSDLFEIYAAQDLPLTGLNYFNITPIDYAVRNFIDLSRKHGPDTIRNMIRLLCKIGANVNEYSGDGTCPLINAYTQDNDLVKLLLELGADEVQYRIYKERIEEQDRIERECRAEQARRDEQERKNRESERKREEAKKNRKKRAKNITGLMLTFAPFILGLVLYYIAFKEFGGAGKFVSDDWLELFIGCLIGSLIFLGIPIVRIHFRDDSRVPSIVIFILAILFITFFFASEDINTYWGSLAMVAAFIMALAYPKEKYWESIEKQERQKARRKEPIKKRFILIPVIIVVALGSLFTVYRLTGSFFKFQQNDQGTITVTGYSGRKEVVIPAAHKGISVTEIGDGAFYERKLTSVSIPDGVTTIGEDAFSNNQLTSVTIPDSITAIGREAFRGNGLTSVVIPNGITTIEWGVFRNNQLTSIVIPDSVITIGEGAFQSNGLTGVTIPDNVITIGKDAFQGNKLTAVTIGNSVTAIGESAFQGNQIGSVVLPNSVTSIEINAFANNPLTSVRIGVNVKLGDIGDFGVLGKGTGFNGAYDKNGKRAGTYTRSDKNSTTWTRR